MQYPAAIFEKLERLVTLAFRTSPALSQRCLTSTTSIHLIPRDHSPITVLNKLFIMKPHRFRIVRRLQLTSKATRRRNQSPRSNTLRRLYKLRPLAPILSPLCPLSNTGTNHLRHIMTTLVSPTKDDVLNIQSMPSVLGQSIIYVELTYYYCTGLLPAHHCCFCRDSSASRSSRSMFLRETFPSARSSNLRLLPCMSQVSGVIY